MHPLSLENIRAVVLMHQVASSEEVDHVVDALYALARDPTTYMFCPRIVQAFGDKALSLVEEGAQRLSRNRGELSRSVVRSAP